MNFTVLSVRVSVHTNNDEHREHRCERHESGVTADQGVSIQMIDQPEMCEILSIAAYRGERFTTHPSKTTVLCDRVLRCFTRLGNLYPFVTKITDEYRRIFQVQHNEFCTSIIRYEIKFNPQLFSLIFPVFF